MRKVLHYKSKFLNRSETFIQRLIRNHQRYVPVATCISKRDLTENLKVFEKPQTGIMAAVNAAAHLVNSSPPFLYNVVMAEEPDILHGHFGYDAYRLIPLARRRDIPLVVSFYGSDVTRLPSEFYWRQRYRKLARVGSRFIACSHIMKGQLVDLGFPDERISVVYFGIELAAFPFRKAIEPAGELMMAGRMVEKKGYETAIETLSLLQKNGHNLKLHLYGDGPLMKELGRLSDSLGVSEQIIFHGFVDNETVRAGHHKHDVFLAPSVTAADGDQEGLPNTIIEAMASGIPVVATRHAAIPEAIVDGETGLLVKERDARQTADAIVRLLGDHQLAEKLRSSARRAVEEKGMTIAAMVETVEKVYDTAIAAHR